MEQDEPREGLSSEMLDRYKVAVERALPRVPVKNGVADIDSVWVETSLPYDLLATILRRTDLKKPPNVERIHVRPRGQPQPGESGGRSRRRGKREVRN
ncbi:MAG: hypothetical protein AB1778_02030 [Candidatus Bipolaricaulota bacterium]